MNVSTGALIVGALGLVYGLSAARLTAPLGGERWAAIGAVDLLVAALLLIVLRG